MKCAITTTRETKLSDGCIFVSSPHTIAIDGTTYSSRDSAGKVSSLSTHRKSTTQQQKLVQQQKKKKKLCKRARW